MQSAATAPSDAHAPATAAATAAPSDVAALPLQVAKRVFAYAIDSRWGRHTYTTEFLPRKCTNAYMSKPELALVSRAWKLMLADLVDEFSALVHHLRLRTGQPSELLALYRELETQTHSGGNKGIRDLRICMGKYGWDNQFVLEKALVSTEVIESLEIDWDRIFASFRKIVRLDLTCIPLNCALQLTQILKAASTHCLELQALVLPMSYRGRIDDEMLMYTMENLYRALEKWFTLGANGGLLQLTVPERVYHTMLNLQELNDGFLNAVAAFCPSIQYLDGWKASYYDDSNLFCGEMWLASLSAWKNFCETCTSIREFNWIVAPFDELFMAEFARHPKVHLKKMTMVCGNQIYDDTVVGLYYRESGFTFTSESIAQVLSACPGLKELHLLFNGANGLSRRFQLCVNDELFRALAAKCPQLKKLVIYEMQTTRIQKPMKNVSDAGLLAISRMPNLEHIALKQTQCSVNGILALIMHALNPRNKRRVVLKIGSTSRPQVCFFDVLIEFMELLVAQPFGILDTHRFELKLRVSSNVANLVNAQATRLKLVALADQVSEQHPALAIHFLKKYGAFEGVPDDIKKVASVVFISPRSMAVSEDGEFETEWTGGPR
ncbi:hypothetical protein Gpo141_00002516 [Globisporangium polare]